MCWCLTWAALRSLVRKRKSSPKKATVPLSQIAAQKQQEQQERQTRQGRRASKPVARVGSAASAGSAASSDSAVKAEGLSAPLETQTTMPSSAPAGSFASGVSAPGEASPGEATRSLASEGATAASVGAVKTASAEPPSASASAPVSASAVSASGSGVSAGAASEHVALKSEGTGSGAASSASAEAGTTAASGAPAIGDEPDLFNGSDPLGEQGKTDDASARPRRRFPRRRGKRDSDAQGEASVSSDGDAGSVETAASGEEAGSDENADAAADGKLGEDAGLDGRAGVFDAEDASAKRRRARRDGNQAGDAPRKVKHHVGLYIVVALVAIVFAVTALFSWDRWLHYDDAVDLQGEWTVAGGSGTVTIDGGSIHLTDAEAYSYTMDSGAKTLSFTFGDLNGTARYRFSADRSQLAIQDGDYGFLDTLGADIVWAFGGMISAIGGQPQPSPSLGEDSLVLIREGALQDAAAGVTTDGAGQDTMDDQTGNEQADGAAGEQQDDAADADAAAGEARQAEEAQQAADAARQALSESGSSSGSVGGNALSPEDLM